MEDNLLEAYFKAYLMVLLMFKHAFVCLVSWHPPSLPFPSHPDLILPPTRGNQCPMFILSTSSAPYPIPLALCRCCCRCPYLWAESFAHSPPPPIQLLSNVTSSSCFFLPTFLFLLHVFCGFFSSVYFITIIPHFLLL